jgi:signal transduction histidine kinase
MIGQQNITVSNTYREAAVVRVDGAQIREAIDAIIANAIEEMPAGASLRSTRIRKSAKALLING